MRASVWLGAVVMLVGGCTSATGDPLAGTGGAGGASGGAAVAGSSGATGGVSPGDCSKPQAAAIRLNPLTESQFSNSVLDIFQVSGSLPPDIGQSFDDVSLEKRASAAAAVAAQAVANLAQWAPCAASAGDPPATCQQQIIDKIGTKAYRRPLGEVERASMTKLFDAGVKEKDFATGVEWFITGLLQSPYFVYQVVRPDAAETVGEARPLSAYEYATRLAYFIWDGPPDDALLAAAASNDLTDPAKHAAGSALFARPDPVLLALVESQRFPRGSARCARVQRDRGQ
jgi:hypothetical protein